MRRGAAGEGWSQIHETTMRDRTRPTHGRTRPAGAERPTSLVLAERVRTKAVINGYKTRPTAARSRLDSILPDAQARLGCKQGSGAVCSRVVRGDDHHACRSEEDRNPNGQPDCHSLDRPRDRPDVSCEPPETPPTAISTTLPGSRSVGRSEIAPSRPSFPEGRCGRKYDPIFLGRYDHFTSKGGTLAEYS